MTDAALPKTLGLKARDPKPPLEAGVAEGEPETPKPLPEPKRVEAARTEIAHERAMQAAPEPGEKLSGVNVMLPGGHVYPIETFVSPTFDFVRNRYLGEPWKLLKDPKRCGVCGHYHYAWPNLNATEPVNTQAMLRSQRYRKVTIEEIQEDSDAPIAVTHEGTDDGVYWNTLVLVEVTHKTWEELYLVPENWAVRRLVREAQSFKQNVAQSVPGVTASVEREE